MTKDLYYTFLKESDFDAVYDTFVRAFSDYQVRMDITKEQFKDMSLRRGLDYELSVGALDNGNMIGLALNGVGYWEQKLTAYDMGTGVVPEFRRRGLAEGMFDFLIPKLRLFGVEQYLLEVIRSNEGAHSLYKKKGFNETRQFECFTAELSFLDLKSGTEAKDDILIEPLEMPDWSLFESFWDYRPSWQNSTASIRRSQNHKIVLGAFKASECVGYGIIYPESGDVPQFAVKESHRRKGIGTLLMKELGQKTEKGRLAVTNVDSSSQVTLNFLNTLGFRNFTGQYEMILEL